MSLTPETTSYTQGNSRSAVGEAGLPQAFVIERSVTLQDGNKLAYTAHEGVLVVYGKDSEDAHLPVTDDLPSMKSLPDDTSVAAMSYVASFVKGEGARERPILFLYNGGPSVSSGTLLVASFGPVLARLPGLFQARGGPYRFGDQPGPPA